MSVKNIAQRTSDHAAGWCSSAKGFILSSLLLEPQHEPRLFLRVSSSAGAWATQNLKTTANIRACVNILSLRGAEIVRLINKTKITRTG